MPVIRRFIAGASCPKCHQLDKILVYQQSGQRFRECVNCGFIESEPKDNTRPQGVATRVEQTDEERAQPIIIIDRAAPRRGK